MRPIVIVLMAAALVVAGLTAFLAKNFLSNQTPQVAAPAKPTTLVLVAAKPLSAGVVLQDADLVWQAWPDDVIDKRFILRGGGEDPRANYVGAIVKRGLAQGEPLSADRLVRQDASGVMTGLLTPGMVAYAVGITDKGGVGGFVLPGDRVDVILSGDLKIQSSVGGPTQAYRVAETILKNVRVLAVDQRMDDIKEGAVVAKQVTLEVTNADAERLASATMMGTLSLALRSLTPGESEESTKGYAYDGTVSKAWTELVGEGGEPKKGPAPRAASQAARESDGGVKIYRDGSLERKSVPR